MTTIQPDKPLRRETSTFYRQRALVIELGPRHVTLREKGKRKGVTVAYDAIYELAFKLEYRARMAEKRAAKVKTKAKGKGKFK